MTLFSLNGLIPLILFLSWLTHTLQAHSPSSFSTKIEQADAYFEATLFDKAIELYCSLLPEPTIHKKAKAHVCLKLAKSYSFTKEYEKIPPLFLEVKLDSVDPDPEIQLLALEGMFLTGLAYNQLNRYSQAVEYLLPFLTFAQDSFPLLCKQASFELGFAYYHLNQFEEAKLRFLEIEKLSPDDRLFPLFCIYLTRIAIKESHPAQARHLLKTLKELEQRDHSFLFTFPFLEGELLFHQKRWQAAAAFFEQALNHPYPGRCLWKEDTLFYLGWCYFYNANLIQSLEELQKAETVFQQLIELFPSEKALLALSQTLLTQGIHFSASEALKNLTHILSTTNLLNTPEGKYQALLFKAEAFPSYLERKQLFRQLTSNAYQKMPLFAESCYLSGLNDLREGIFLKEKGLKARKPLEEAIESFKKSFELLYYASEHTVSNKRLAAQAMKYQAQAYSELNHREGALQGLSILSQLLNRYREDLFPLLEEPDEIYFLQGQIASTLLEEDQTNPFLTLAENSLIHSIESYPNGNYAEASLQLLGSLYYQKKDYEKGEQIFLQLAQKFSSSSYSKEAWHWAANCAEHQKESIQRVRQYRKKLFELYPDSSFAAEAFFRYYSLKDYSQGKPEALLHLQKMSEQFPHSSYLTITHYLLGLNALSRSMPQEAISHFQQAADAFHPESIEEKQQSFFAEVRFRALLEKASLHSLRGELKEQLILLSSLYQEGNPSKTTKILYPIEQRLEEECAYRFALSLIAVHEEKQAETVILGMLEKYQSAKITRGYYLSRAWYQKGLLASKQENYQLALSCFTHAEDAAKGKVLNVDELLDLWIEKSLCYTLLEQLDEAMLILSQIINYDAVSSLRLKAMFLRAEIYQKQGRMELAKRQLEAIAKKGGPWAQKAQEKLKGIGPV